MEIKIVGDAEKLFITGYDNADNPKVAYLAVPLERILSEGRFGQVVFLGELEVFKREVEHCLGMLHAKKAQGGLITPGMKIIR